VQEPLARRVLPRVDRREIAVILAGGALGTLSRRRRPGAAATTRSALWPSTCPVGAGEQIGRVLPEPGALLRRPLLTLERVRVCKLMVYTSETVRHQGQPVHRAIVRQLRSAGLSGATTLRGIWGFHGDHAPHGDRLLQLGRHVPTVTVVIDTPERIAGAYGIIDELTSERGLVTCETIGCLDEAGAGNAGVSAVVETFGPRGGPPPVVRVP
jgi:PII-like signaling protein